MPLNVERLEQLLTKLQELARRLEQDHRDPERALGEDDPLVRLADDCEFRLPSPLTAGALSATVQRKIDNVKLLLERARQQQEIPAAARVAAENEDNLVDPERLPANGQPARSARAFPSR